MTGFADLIYNLKDLGVHDIILPFILIFTIIFAVLEKIKIFGEGKQTKNYSVVIAMVSAFAVIIPHVTNSYYRGYDPVVIINTFLPNVAILLVAIVMMLLTVGLWTGERIKDKKTLQWFTWISLIIVGFIFMASANWLRVPYWLNNLISSDVISLVIAILVFGIIIKFIVNEGDKPPSDEDKIKLLQSKVDAAKKAAEKK